LLRLHKMARVARPFVPRRAQLNTSADITDPTIAKAYAHPLRIEIMGLLDNRVASPRELAIELGASLPTTSYHVRQLAAMKLIKLVRRRQRRGSIEHFYTAIVRPRVYDDVWSQIPGVVKRALVGGRLSQLGKEVFAAAEAGGFDRDDMHLTRTRMTLTAKGWRDVAKGLAALLERFEKIKADDAARLEEDPDAVAIAATAVMMLFEAPPPGAFRSAAAVSEADELEDVVPHG
jgi:DNA-binding transcriptional ArsR family regulator